MRFFTAEQTRLAEENAVRLGMSWLRLMENAGSAAARVIREKYKVHGKRIAVVCGRGNNGGDGYVVARKLFESGAKVSVIQTETPGTSNSGEMLKRIMDFNIPVTNYEKNREEAVLILKGSSIIIDAIFGTGFHGSAEDNIKDLIEYINITSAKVVSLDLPSGAICDNGDVEGVCVKADITISFTVYKPCHVLLPSAEYCGEIIVVSIGMPQEAVDPIPTTMQSIEHSDITPMLEYKKRNTHKGEFGSALLVCGSRGMAGAAAISAKAALRTGAGLVKLAIPKSIYTPLAAALFEPIFHLYDETTEGTISLSAIRKLIEEANSSTAILIGCGIGKGLDVRKLVDELICNSRVPIVLDADGINAICGRIDIIKRTKSPLILTPHPGEMARLLDISVAEVQNSRLKIATEFACKYGVTLVLKGSGTITATPDGKAFINLTGNPGMSTGGSGDMLAGMIVTFLAQGMNSQNAANCAVYLHGLAGDRTAARLSQRAMTPTDMIEELSLLFHEIETVG